MLDTSISQCYNTINAKQIIRISYNSFVLSEVFSLIKAREGVLMRRRILEGWSMHDMAQKAGINRSVICRAENGGGVNPKSAKAICAVLGTDFDTLFEIVQCRGV